MTLEVRQMVIKSTVGDAESAGRDTQGPATGTGGLSPADRLKLKHELLEECRSWLLEQLERSKER